MKPFTPEMRRHRVRMRRRRTLIKRFDLMSAASATLAAIGLSANGLPHRRVDWLTFVAVWVSALVNWLAVYLARRSQKEKPPESIRTKAA